MSSTTFVKSFIRKAFCSPTLLNRRKTQFSLFLIQLAKFLHQSIELVELFNLNTILPIVPLKLVEIWPFEFYCISVPISKNCDFPTPPPRGGYGSLYKAALRLIHALSRTDHIVAVSRRRGLCLEVLFSTTTYCFRFVPEVDGRLCLPCLPSSTVVDPLLLLPSAFRIGYFLYFNVIYWGSFRLRGVFFNRVAVDHLLLPVCTGSCSFTVADRRRLPLLIIVVAAFRRRVVLLSIITCCLLVVYLSSFSDQGPVLRSFSILFVK